MRILLTGAGYLGCKIINGLLADEHQVLVLDNFMYGHYEALNYVRGNQNLTIVHADVRNKHILSSHIKAFKPNIICPLAAIVGMDACNRQPILAKQVNYEQIVNMVNYIDDSTLLMYFNTNSAYGKQQAICTEDSPMNPISLYAQTKCDAEKYVLANHSNYIVLRLATVFGISPRMRSDLLVNHLTYKAFLHGELEIFEPDFKRNFIHIGDVVGAVCALIDQYSHGKLDKQYNVFGGTPKPIFNLGFDAANTTKGKLAKLICQVTNSTYKIGQGKDLDGRDYNVSSDKILKHYEPSIGLKEGILELLDYYSCIWQSTKNEFGGQREEFAKVISKMSNV